MHTKEIIFIKEGYSIVYNGRTFRAGDTFEAPLDLANLLIREGNALPYKSTILPEPKSNG